MQEQDYLDMQWVIYNSSLGVHDLVTIERIVSQDGSQLAWLDEPYEMVGPFHIDTLLEDGIIPYEACFIISLEYWRTHQKELMRESLLQRTKMEEEMFKELRNSKRKNKELEYRELLELPTHGALNTAQIKAAFRKLAKKNHPDVGGEHEMFVRMRFAYDSLLESLC